MGNKRFSGRVQHLRGTSAEWTEKNPVILDGETIVVETNDGSTRYKTGDGVKRYTDLPFTDEKIYAAIGNKADASKTIELMLQASGWSDESQTLISDDIKSDAQNGVISLSQSANDEEINAARSAMLRVVSQSAGSIIVKYDGEKPSINIPVSLILFG